ncbi:TIGR01777 family oxidoreductase [Paenibacillus glucanolyticus]|uniref:TIGR01777 family oxidoreductase n=1 Tax=Paenibacillus glucanolyticus TaxID=59843 RepID=UPI00096E9004|nr:TIGR01777 family oxidoreductase [Paenibacillus glucanolyticus]OMF83081.1 TIGR01777 family protein [Paenibacillus glucanolyticus]
MKKIVLAGGTGFIGSYFEKKFTSEQAQVYMISRQEGHISWDDHEGMVAALEGADMLINLAGKSVNCRYHERNKELILKSRIDTTKRLGRAIQACENPPLTWFNSSTATIYRHAEDRPMTEESGEIGSGFSVKVAEEWEQAFFSFPLDRTRQIALRIAIVLGPDGGVMTPYMNLVKYGLGGEQGTGNQRFSWIHVEDLYRIVLFLQENKELSGIFNCASPHPVPNRELMKLLRQALNRRFGLPSPKWLLELGARMIQTETELILKSRWVIPDRLMKSGFDFKYDKLHKALTEIVKK